MQDSFLLSIFPQFFSWEASRQYTGPAASLSFHIFPEKLIISWRIPSLKGSMIFFKETNWSETETWCTRACRGAVGLSHPGWRDPINYGSGCRWSTSYGIGYLSTSGGDVKVEIKIKILFFVCFAPLVPLRVVKILCFSTLLPSLTTPTPPGSMRPPQPKQSWTEDMWGPAAPPSDWGRVYCFLSH